MGNSNSEIIAKEAVASGYYTEDEVAALIAEGKDIDFHTFSVWKKRYGLVPKKGTKGWEAKLWRIKKDRATENGNTAPEDGQDSQFYLAKSFLFHKSQCVAISEEEK